MTFPEIPADVAASVKRLFRSEKRKAIAMELLYFDYWPVTEEKQKIADRYEMHVTSIDKILYRLRDSDLFTKEQGSIPLYRVKLGEEVAFPPREEGTDGRESDADMNEGRRLSESYERNLEDEQPIEEELERDLQENRLKKIEVTLHNQGEKFDNFMAEMRTTIHQLSGGSPENNPGSEDSLIDPTELSQPETVEERLERIERLVQEGSGGDPFDGMSREQIIELVRSQPQDLISMVNPDGRGIAGRIEGQPVTLRPMILMLTTYSQMLYERAVYDGHFEGTLSDFANFTMEQYFTDRGWGLDWHKREPASMRRSLG